jgi:hypothetical protein
MYEEEGAVPFLWSLSLSIHTRGRTKLEGPQDPLLLLVPELLAKLGLVGSDVSLEDLEAVVNYPNFRGGQGRQEGKVVRDDHHAAVEGAEEESGRG